MTAEELEAKLACRRKTTAIAKSCGIVIASVMRIVLRPFVQTWFAKTDDSNTTLRASLVQPLKKLTFDW
ncbi:MAG: hypothetical protein ACTS43_00040 [Candidatus Hodgkinia cicadicola]